METIETTSETATETTAETTSETITETVTVVQVLPDNINHYISEQSHYSAWVIILLSVIIGVLLLGVFFDRWKF